MNVKRFELAGVPVDDVSMSQSVTFAKKAINEQRQVAIFAMNPEKVIAARSNPELFRMLAEAELLIPDGIGAVVAARLKGAKMRSRVPGAELMPELCKMAAAEGFGVFLFGASEEVNAEAAKKLIERYPKLNIVGRQNGYLEAHQYQELVASVNESGAQLMFLALGSPKQEMFISQYRDDLSVNVLQGVGGTFDVIAGRVKRAPKLFRKLHLEWLYRLLSQPSRLFRQTALPKFVALVMIEKLGFKL